MIVIICAKYKKNPSWTVDAAERTRFSKSRPNDLEDIGHGQGSSHATPPLMLLIICTKYGKNPSWTVDATGRTQKVNGQTGWIQYTPLTLLRGCGVGVGWGWGGVGWGVCIVTIAIFINGKQAFILFPNRILSLVVLLNHRFCTSGHDNFCWCICHHDYSRNPHPRIFPVSTWSQIPSSGLVIFLDTQCWISRYH